MRLFFSILTFCVLLTGCNSTSSPQVSDSRSIKNMEEDTPPQPQRFILSEGMQVSLTPPFGFQLTPEHHGFVQAESFSRIKVYEVEEPYKEYLPRLSQENLAREKLRLIKQQQVTIANAVCSEFILEQVISGTVFNKQILACGDELSVVVVETSYPEGASEKQQKEINDAAHSLSVNVNQSLRVYTGLPFMFAQTPGYKITKRFRNSLVLESTPKSGVTSEVVLSYGTSKSASVSDLAEQLISRVTTSQTIEILRNENSTLANFPALTTTAHVGNNQENYWFKQLLSYHNAKFLLVHARAPKTEAEKAEQNLDALLSHLSFK